MNQAQVKAIQSSPRPRLLVTAQNQSSLVRSVSDGNNVTKDSAPNLQALLSTGKIMFFFTLSVSLLNYGLLFGHTVRNEIYYTKVYFSTPCRKS